MGLGKFLMIFRDLSRRAFLTCSLPTEQVRRIERGRYEDAEASSTEPRGLHVLAVRLFTTCSLLISFVFYKETAFCLYRLFFIRNQRLALVAFFGFFNEEYLIALVDLIAPCGGTKEWGRRDLRIPPSPPSGLPPFQPWGIAAAG